MPTVQNSELEKINAALNAKERQIESIVQADLSAQPASASTVQMERPIGKQWWRADEAMTISAAVLLFGIVVMMMMTTILHKSKTHPDAILRLFGTIIIIIGALFLIVAGYTDTQMGPVMGLLGTIAGYLLGKNSNPATVSDKDEVQSVMQQK